MGNRANRERVVDPNSLLSEQHGEQTIIRSRQTLGVTQIGQLSPQKQEILRQYRIMQPQAFQNPAWLLSAFEQMHLRQSRGTLVGIINAQVVVSTLVVTSFAAEDKGTRIVWRSIVLCYASLFCFAWVFSECWGSFRNRRISRIKRVMWMDLGCLVLSVVVSGLTDCWWPVQIFIFAEFMPSLVYVCLQHQRGSRLAISIICFTLFGAPAHALVAGDLIWKSMHLFSQQTDYEEYLGSPFTMVCTGVLVFLVLLVVMKQRDYAPRQPRLLVFHYSSIFYVLALCVLTTLKLTYLQDDWLVSFLILSTIFLLCLALYAYATISFKKRKINTSGKILYQKSDNYLVASRLQGSQGAFIQNLANCAFCMTESSRFCYKCHHVCVCYECAPDLLQRKIDKCPYCRKVSSKLLELRKIANGQMKIIDQYSFVKQ